MGLHVVVDHEKCCGAGQCVLVAPEVFDQNDDDGIVVLLEADPGDDQRGPVTEAAQVCPGAAITLEERS
jgi:ferredoxin